MTELMWCPSGSPDQPYDMDAKQQAIAAILYEGNQQSCHGVAQSNQYLRAQCPINTLDTEPTHGMRMFTCCRKRQAFANIA